MPNPFFLAAGIRQICKRKARQSSHADMQATNGNDGLVWQHKGVGYYSECKNAPNKSAPREEIGALATNMSSALAKSGRKKLREAIVRIAV